MTKCIVIRSLLMTMWVITRWSLTTNWVITRSPVTTFYSHVVNWVMICHFSCPSHQNVFSLSRFFESHNFAEIVLPKFPEFWQVACLVGNWRKKKKEKKKKYFCLTGIPRLSHCSKKCRILWRKQFGCMFPSVGLVFFVNGIFFNKIVQKLMQIVELREKVSGMAKWFI